MRIKSLLLTLTILTVSAFSAQAQIDATINPIGLLFGGINVGADFAINDEFSIEGTLGYNSNDDVTVLISDISSTYSYTGIPVQAVGKYYFNPNRGADKFYAAAFLRYVNRDYEQNDVTDPNTFTQSRFGFGFGVGAKSVSQSGVVFDFGLNLGRVIAENVSINDTDIDLPDVIIGIKIGIGYRFGA